MQNAVKILVVDDEVGICKNVEKILTKNKHAVTCAFSAQEALEKMAQQQFELVISDIVMPHMNGLEFLKTIKSQWPLTKAVMITAYASTETAVKAIRLGALDYLPKPFTPNELRAVVEQALTGKLIEAKVSAKEKQAINIIDVDLPFDPDEVAQQTGEGYTRMLDRSDMPVVEVKMPEPLEGFCELGTMVCDIFKKLGATCKAGTKTGTCPQKKAKKKKKTATTGSDVRALVGIDQPFLYDEVATVTGPEYIQHLQSDGVVVPYYETLKENVEQMMVENGSEKTAKVEIEISASAHLEGFCEVGSMVCDIFKKLGATCKAGTKTGDCPKLKAKKGKSKATDTSFDGQRLIAVDMPFDQKEVTAITGPDYVAYLSNDGVAQIPYEQLKANYRQLLAQQAAAEEKDPSLIVRKSVLVIDDEVAVNRNIRKILVKKGYAVDQATSKDEALERIRQRAYQLILLDLKMPGVKGLELLNEIRADAPQAMVIMITGYASIETAKEAARLGAIDYLPKPFTPDEIRSATSRAFALTA